MSGTAGMGPTSLGPTGEGPSLQKSLGERISTKIKNAAQTVYDRVLEPFTPEGVDGWLATGGAAIFVISVLGALFGFPHKTQFLFAVSVVTGLIGIAMMAGAYHIWRKGPAIPKEEQWSNSRRFGLMLRRIAYAAVLAGIMAFLLHAYTGTYGQLATIIGLGGILGGGALAIGGHLLQRRAKKGLKPEEQVPEQKPEIPSPYSLHSDDQPTTT